MQLEMKQVMEQVTSHWTDPSLDSLTVKICWYVLHMSDAIFAAAMMHGHSGPLDSSISGPADSLTVLTKHDTSRKDAAWGD